MKKEIAALLHETDVVVSPELFTLVSLRQAAWLDLLTRAELSPRMSAPFMIFYDNFEVTMLLDEEDFGKIRSAIPDVKHEAGFRMVSLDKVLGFGVTGFLAEVACIMSKANVPILTLSSFSRDHLLIKQNDLALALKALGPLVRQLC